MSVKKSLIPAIGIVGIVAGGAAAYLYLKGNFSDAANPIASAKVVPDEALMATFISTDPKPWSQLQQFGTPEAEKLIEKGFQDFNQQLLTQSHIDYEKDLKPWVSSVMVAVLPSNPSSSVQFTPQSKSPTSLLMVVGIKDKLSAWNFANKLKSDQTLTTQEINYKGEKITETASKGESTYSSVLSDRLVLASDRQAVEQAIDTYKGEPSFANKDGVESLLSKGVNLKNSVVQIYLPDYAGVMQQLIESSPNRKQLPPEALIQLQQVKSMVAGVGIDEAGIRMKAIALLDPNAIKVDYQPSAGKIVNNFPADTFALISGMGISRQWSAFVDQTKNISEVNLALGYARQYLKTYNLNLDKDVFGWMDGEFALAAIPSSQGLLANIGFGGALVFDTSDRAGAEATLNKLDAIARNNFVTVASRDIGGKTITEWQVPFQGSLLGHGWLDNDTVFVALGGSIADAIATSPNSSLNNSDAFKAVTGSLQQPNAGYFYLDMDRTMSFVSSATQNHAITPEASAILNSIRGIGMTASSPDKSISEMELLLALKPRKS
ncbi:MAG TPA: metalloendopeptidase [Cyanobacteria bacterium UBA11049]|nr:metalloendopeptidase [Cyanobacteria bacterium UBA11049]